MTTGQPRVSVFIPVYNRAHLVQGAIDSVLAQGFVDFELLVIDDGSTDDTADIVARNHDPRLRLIRNPENMGIPLTRQRGLEDVRAPYLALLDSDDRMRPDRLAQQVAYLDAQPDIAIVGGNVQRYRPDGRRAGRVMQPQRPEELRAWLLFRNANTNTTLMGRTDILRRYGYRAEFPVSEDFDLAARMAPHHRVANLPRVLTDKLEHAGRVTTLNVEKCRLTKTAIMRDQLVALGVNFDEEDLARHYWLPRLQAANIARWPDYADWAADWIAQLKQANTRTRVYDRRALRAVLGLVWAQCCVRMVRHQGWRSARSVFRHGLGITALPLVARMLPPVSLGRDDGAHGGLSRGEDTGKL